MKSKIVLIIFGFFAMLLGGVASANGKGFGENGLECPMHNIDENHKLIDTYKTRRWSDRFVIYNNTPLCENQVLRLATVYFPEVTYSWYNPKGEFIGAAYLLDLPPKQISGYYKLEICHPVWGTYKDSCFVFITPLPAPPALIEKMRVCEGKTVTLEVNGAQKLSQYFWTLPNLTKKQGAKYELKNISLSSTGSYKCYAIEKGCTSMPAQILLEVLPIPKITQINTPLSICEGENLNLSIQSAPEAHYYWLGPNGIETHIKANNFIKYNIDATYKGRHQLVAYLGQCTSSVHFFDLNVAPRPMAPVVIYSDSVVCLGNDFQARLLPKIGYSMFWQFKEDYFYSDTFLIKANQINEFPIRAFSVAEGCTSKPVELHPKVAPPLSLPHVIAQPIKCITRDTLKLEVKFPETDCSYYWNYNNLFFSEGTQLILGSDVLLKENLLLICQSKKQSCLSPPLRINLDSLLSENKIEIEGNFSLAVSDTLNIKVSAIPDRYSSSYYWEFPNKDLLIANEIVIPSIQKYQFGAYSVYRIEETCTTQFQRFFVTERPATALLTERANNRVAKYKKYLEEPLPIGLNYTLLSSVLEGSLRNLASNREASPNRIVHSPASFFETGSNSGSNIEAKRTKEAETQQKIQFASISIPSLPTRKPYIEFNSNTFLQQQEGAALQSNFFISEQFFANSQVNIIERQEVAEFAPHHLENILKPGTYCVGDTLVLDLPDLVAGEVFWQLPNGYNTREKRALFVLSDTSFSGVWLLTVLQVGKSQQFKKSVKVASLPTKPKVFDRGDFCLGGSFTLQARPVIQGYSYIWCGPNSERWIGPVANISKAANHHSGKYWLELKNEFGCSLKVEHNVVLNKDSLTVYTNQPVCPGKTIEISALYNEKAVYSWSGPYSFSSTDSRIVILNAQPGHSGEYVVYGRVGECEPVQRKVVVNVIPLPGVLEVEYAKPICLGKAANFRVSAMEGVNYRWLSPSGAIYEGNNIHIDKFTDSENGNWILEAHLGHCGNRDTVAIYGFDCRQPCSLPFGWVLQRIASNRAQVNWSPLQRYASCVVLSYGPRAVSPENWQKVNITFPVSSFIIPELASDVEYGVRMQVNCSNCSMDDGVRSIWSETFYFKTPPVVQNEMKESALSVFPENEKGSFVAFFSSKNEIPAKIVVKNILGKVIYQEQITTTIGFNKINIQLNGLLQGSAKVQLIINNQIHECYIGVH